MRYIDNRCGVFEAFWRLGLVKVSIDRNFVTLAKNDCFYVLKENRTRLIAYATDDLRIRTRG
jgi:hypothetical protein